MAETEVKTSSINEAAFVVARGMSHPSFEWVTDSLCLFSFNCGKAEQLIDEYQKGGLIEAKRYAGVLAHLKSAMFKSRK